MRAPGKQLAVLLTATLTAPALVGCDTDTGKADKAVVTAVEEGIVKYREGADDDARTKFESAAREAAASPEMKAYAKSVQAQAEVDAAQSLLAELERTQLDATRLIWEMRRVANQVGHSIQLSENFKQLEPKQARADLQKKVEEVQGGAGAEVWVTTEGAVIPTAAAVKATVDRLTGEIGKKEEELKGLRERRAAALTQADEANNASLTAKGEESVKIYNRGAEQRKQAHELQIDIEKGEAALVPLQRDLAVAKAQETVLAETVKTFQDQLTEVDARWKKVEEQINAQGEQARQMAQSSEGESVAAKATRLGELLKRMNDLRSQAGVFLNSAASHYAEAATAADTMRTQFREKISATDSPPAQADGWQDLMEIFNSGTYKARQGHVHHVMGNMHASHVALLRSQADLVKALQEVYTKANVSLPQEIDASTVEQSYQEALGQARGAYGEANQTLADVATGSVATVDTKTAAHVARSLVQYAWALLERGLGNTTEADQHVTDALGAAREAVGADPSQFPQEIASQLRQAAPPAPAAPAAPETPAPAPGPEAAEPEAQTRAQ